MRLPTRSLAAASASALVAASLVLAAPAAVADVVTAPDVADDQATSAPVDPAAETTDAPAPTSTDASAEDPAAPAPDETAALDEADAPADAEAPADDAVALDETADSDAAASDDVAARALPEGFVSVEDARGAAAGATVSTVGWVTATYPTGGINGFVIQAPGTGGACDLDGVSDAIFVYTGNSSASAAIGDFVEVTGVRGAFRGLEQISIGDTGTVAVADGSAEAAAEPVTCAWPEDEAGRAALQSMLFAPEGDFVVTNNYDANTFGALTLSTTGEPLRQPTDVAAYGTAAYDEVVAYNEASRVILDDGATSRFAGGAFRDEIPPYVYADGAASVGASVEFTEPVIVDYRNNAWTLNPVTQVRGGTENLADLPVTFAYERPGLSAGLDADVTVGALNVENLFTTLGEDWTADGAVCTSYTDRSGAPVTVNRCPGEGPRGAWDQTNLDRQVGKLVATISGMDASVIGLMEIENSAKLGAAPDTTVAYLVDALNSASGAETWAYVPTVAAELPPLAEQDVITQAIIYQPAEVTPVGAMMSLDDLSGPGAPFSNAREPIGATFEPAGGGEAFVVVANHFKSKSGSDDMPAEEADTGQGAFNASRVAQATAVADWIETDALPAAAAAAGTEVEDVFVVGDLNAYTFEDPMLAFYDRGYVNTNVVGGVPQDSSYNFSGLNGSLDHVLVSQSVAEKVTGHVYWNINSPEQIGLGYNRWNNTPGDFVDPTSPFRSSDHDPAIVGMSTTAAGTVEVNLLNINDFHGRVDGVLTDDDLGLASSSTVQFAGTVEELTAAYGAANSLFLSAGDNVGASLFASSIQQDVPTIEVLNALGLRASAIGNHEFDAGWADVERIESLMDGALLGANVYAAGTTDPLLPEYVVLDAAGQRVAVIGVVTQETPTLVNPSLLDGVEFGDPVEAVNRVAAEIVAGDLADVIVAEYHEGAPEDYAGQAPVYAAIVEETSPEVDVIFTGHTHQEYVWDADIPGTDRTRPIVQTGSYGTNVGQVVLEVDSGTGDVIGYEARLVPTTTTPMADLVSTYPAVAEVYDIVLAAMIRADIEGSVVTGELTAPITRAFTNGQYVDGLFERTEESAEDRAQASTLGTLIANALRESTRDLATPPDFGVVNPGGIRADLTPNADGEITVADARAVLPFNNELSVVSLTGAQVITMLEQQWQRNDVGAVPSRPYLQLGLSDNVRYTFSEIPEPGYDDGRTVGVIHSVTIDGVPLDPEATYRIGTFSFLAAGGDNFWVFDEASEVVNTGLLDWSSWLVYLDEASPISPDVRRAGIEVDGLADTALTPGETRTVTVGRVDIPSVGAPLNTEVTASLAPAGAMTVLAEAPPVTAPLVDGVAQLSLTVPTDAAAGDAVVTLIAQPTETTGTVPVAVTAAPGGGVDPGEGSGGVGSGSGGSGTGAGSGGLPATGSNIDLAGLALLAGLLVAVGSGALVVRRVRTRA